MSSARRHVPAGLTHSLPAGWVWATAQSDLLLQLPGAFMLLLLLLLLPPLVLPSSSLPPTIRSRLDSPARVTRSSKPPSSSSSSSSSPRCRPRRVSLDASPAEPRRGTQGRRPRTPRHATHAELLRVIIRDERVESTVEEEIASADRTIRPSHRMRCSADSPSSALPDGEMQRPLLPSAQPPRALTSAAAIAAMRMTRRR